RRAAPPRRAGPARRLLAVPSLARLQPDRGHEPAALRASAAGPARRAPPGRGPLRPHRPGPRPRVRRPRPPHELVPGGVGRASLPVRGGLTQVRVWGDAAVVTAQLWVKGTRDGKTFDRKLWFSDTYVRTKDGWRYVFGQASLPLPAQP